MSQTKDFLARVLPWPPAGTPGAYLNIHYSFTKEDEPKLLWFGTASTTLDDLTRQVNRLAGQSNVQGVYVCMSSQRMATQKQSANGFTYFKAERSAMAAVEHRSFYLDTDVKEGAYATQAEALAALNSFMGATGLPMPTAIVASGSGGFHCHWVLERPITTLEWKPYAHALAHATQQHGLICDTQCTVDAARILRVPGTWNKKSGTAKEVKLLCNMVDGNYANELLYEKLQPYIVGNASTEVLPAAFGGGPVASLAGVSDLAAGVTRDARPVILPDVAKECAFVGDALRDGGKDYNNPLWNLTTLIASFSEDGREMAHAMAKGHAGYTPEDTDNLFTRKLSERVNQNLGWPQCKTIAASGCTACAACPHFAAQKSPLNLGRASVQPMPSAGDLPPKYMRDPSGLVYLRTMKEDGESSLSEVAPYPIIAGWVQDHPWTLFFDTAITPRHVKQIRLPFEVINGKDVMQRELAKQGFGITGKQTQMLGEFFMSWINQLRGIKSAVVSASPYGWFIENGREAGFTYGGKIFQPQGERQSAKADSVICEQYAPKGTIDPWRAAVKLITDQKRPELDLILAAAFAAPLVRFTGQRGALISAYSAESGIGKSTAMAVGCAVWADPVRAMQALTDTQNSVMGKLEELKALPLFWDELKTEEDTVKFVNIAFQITGGKGKARMNADTSQRTVGTWETMIVLASNDSLVDTVVGQSRQTAAGLYRLFEYTVTPGVIGQISNSEAARLVQECNDNYGNAGLVYAEFLGKNHALVKKQIGDMLLKLEKECNALKEERFWFVCAGTILMGAIYANGLKLTNIDLVALKQLVVRTIHSMRDIRANKSSDVKNAVNVANVLTQFLTSQSARYTLWTDVLPLGAGKPKKSKVLRSTDKLDGVYVHIAITQGVIRIASTRLTEWLKQHGYSRHLLIEELKSQFQFKEVVGQLGGGTDYATGKQYLLEVFTPGTPLQDYLDNFLPDQPEPKEGLKA